MTSQDVPSSSIPNLRSSPTPSFKSKETLNGPTSLPEAEVYEHAEPKITATVQDIEYLYLTFSTEVPTIPIFPSEASPAEFPPCPKLKQYDNPFSWSKTRKNVMTYVSCTTNICAAWSAGSYAYPAEQLEKEWGISYVAYIVGISIFTYGFGFAPMILAPFSEINGRRPVFIVTGVLFVICQMCCALTQSYGGMLAARFWAGVGGCTWVVL